jgi:acyl-CoA thioester hydrolase
LSFLLAESFKHYTQIDIRYRDLDALAHVNNAAYLTYLEQARITYFRDIAVWDGHKSPLGVIVARICIDYKLALRLEDQGVMVWTRISSLGNKSFTLGNMICRIADDSVAAQSEIVMVAYNYTQDQTVAIPDTWRRAIAAYEPGLKQA